MNLLKSSMKMGPMVHQTNLARKRRTLFVGNTTKNLALMAKHASLNTGVLIVVSQAILF